MFTGLVTDIGKVVSVKKRDDLRLRIQTSYKVSTIDIGASISVDGICLTVVELGQDWFDVEVSEETLAKTNLLTRAPHEEGEHLPLGRRVNLERSLKVGDEIGGHMVSGHVDGTARVASMNDNGGSTRVFFEVPNDLAKFIAAKGSVTLNGTSLTVNEIDGNKFGVNLIPYTKTATKWSDVSVGEKVNLEIDVLARYVNRLHDFL